MTNIEIISREEGCRKKSRLQRSKFKNGGRSTEEEEPILDNGVCLDRLANRTHIQ